MGTNFYYKIPLKKRDKENLHEMVDKLPEEGFYLLKDKLEELEKASIIHLGKRSYGWQFLWDYHDGRFYSDSLESIMHYLNNGEGVIYNEYGETFTVKQFFDDEIMNCLYKDEKHCDAFQYHQQYPEEPLFYNINDHEFTSDDGLRFCKDEDFS